MFRVLGVWHPVMWPISRVVWATGRSATLCPSPGTSWRATVMYCDLSADTLFCAVFLMSVWKVARRLSFLCSDLVRYTVRGGGKERTEPSKTLVNTKMSNKYSRILFLDWTYGELVRPGSLGPFVTVQGLCVRGKGTVKAPVRWCLRLLFPFFLVNNISDGERFLFAIVKLEVNTIY